MRKQEMKNCANLTLVRSCKKKYLLKNQLRRNEKKKKKKDV